jgi:hypothetical protein
VENTAEDINSSEDIRERRKEIRRHIRFLFAYKYCRSGAGNCQGFTWKLIEIRLTGHRGLASLYGYFA